MRKKDAKAPRDLKRHDDWPSRLLALVAERRDRAFAWGRHDCALFACDAVRTMTGVDPAKSLRGTYRSALGARRALKEHAGGGLTATARKIAKVHGCAEVPVLLARRGDLAIVETDIPGGKRVLSLGVVIGENVMVPGVDSIVAVPLAEARRAWRI